MTTITQPAIFQRNHLIRDAMSQAIYECVSDDPSIYLYGEGAWVKQYYDAPRIYKDFPSRIVTMPISEDGNLNFAVGAALMGVKPIVNVISGDFLYRAMDSIVNNAAKLNATGGNHTLVIQAEFLLGGPTTGQRNEALFTHIPGLRVAMPSTPHDAYGLMRTALATPGVTLLFEDRMIRDDGPFAKEDLLFDESVPFGKVSMRKYGSRGQPLILTYGLMRQVVERAVEPWSGVRVLDLRTLYPIDWETLRWCMSRHNMVLIVEPDIAYGGIGAEIAATLAEEFVCVQIKRLGAPRITAPASQALHHHLLPTEEDIVAALNSFNN